MDTNSAALLMRSPEWCKRHFRRKHIDFLISTATSTRFPTMGKAVFGCGLR